MTYVQEERQPLTWKGYMQRYPTQTFEAPSNNSSMTNGNLNGNVNAIINYKPSIPQLDHGPMLIDEYVVRKPF